MSIDRLSTSRLQRGDRARLTWVERTSAVLAFHGTVYRRTWRGGVISRLILPVLILTSLGIGVGGLVNSASGGVDGVPYLSYVVPGLLMSSAMQWAVGEATYPVMTYLKWNQMYAVMVSAPLGVADVIRGHWIMITVGIGAGSVAFTGIAAVLGGVSSWWALLAVPLSVLMALAFVAPLFAFAAWVNTDEAFTSIFRLVVTPLMLFSGTFYPIALLPTFLQMVAWVTPLWHGTELARAAFLGHPMPALWPVHVGILIAYVVVGHLLTVRAFTRRLVS